MNFITTSGIGRCSVMRLILSFIALCIFTCTQAAMAQSGVTLTLTKTNDAPSPIPSGQVFTYTIAYTWSGGTGWSPMSPGTLVITDPVPAAFDVISAAPGSPVSTIVGNTVTFTLNNIVAPSGTGFVQINVRFKPGVTCNGAFACNIAYIKVPGDQRSVQSNESCVRASAANNWQFQKDYIAGCLLDSVVTFRISVINPSGNDIGGLNLTNISLTDILPAGAQLVGVIPMNPGDWNGPATGSGSVGLTGGPTSLNVQSGWGWWGCYVQVVFPSTSFSVGQTVTNNATLRFRTPCTPQGQTETMNSSASVTLCAPTPPQPGGYIWKGLSSWLYFPSNPWYTPSWAPGCCGTYYLFYQNNGTATQSNIEMNDTVPSTIDIGTIYTHLPSGMTSVTLDIFCYSGGSCGTTPCATVTYGSPGWYTYSPSGLSGPICHVRWRYTGNLTSGNYIYNYMNACVRSNSWLPPNSPVLAGDNIANKVCVKGTNVPANMCDVNNSTVTATQPNILAGKFFAGKSGTCMPGCSPDMTGPFYPGDVIRWRMVVANVGNTAATPCTISDVLPAGFTYQGNETYYYGPLYWSSATNPPCCSMTSTAPSAIGGLSTPSVGQTSLIWNFTTLPANCNGNVDYLVIEFDAKANDNPTIAPGQYFNTFDFTATNLSGTVTSNPAQVTINGYAQIQLYKEVRQLIGPPTFSSSATVQAGSQAEFRLRVANTGILTLTNIYLLDILPHIGDITVLPIPTYVARGSGYDYPIDVAMSSIFGYNYGYNSSTNTKNPRRSTLFCSTPDPTTGLGPVTPGIFGGWGGSTYSFEIVGLPATTIAPGGQQDFFYTATVPPGTQAGLIACNSYGFQAYPAGTSICMKAESSPACVEVIPPDHNECDSIWGDVEIGECCTATVHILNTLGSLTELHYNVLPVGGGSTPSGVVQGINTTPCLPSSTVPGSLAGTTSGTLYYSPPCSSPLSAQIHATSTSATGEICIELTAVITRADGTLIECTDTVCFRCDPAPQDRCDSLGVRAFPSKQMSMRTFTIYNLKSPSSPICRVKIDYSPAPSSLVGSNLLVDGVPQSWPAGSSSSWRWITSAHGLPANSTVQFDLGIPYTIGWTGTVTVTVYHCDGDSCQMRYGPWDATKNGTVIIGTPTDVPDRTTLHIHSLSFSRDDAADLGVRSIGIYYNDPVTGIVAATGATYPCSGEQADGSDCNDLLEGVHVDGTSMMIDLRRDLADPANRTDPVVTVVYSANSDENPSVEVIYYDANGQEVGHEQIDITGRDQGRAVSGLRGPNEVSANDRIATMLGALSARPNPTSGNCDVAFKLTSPSMVELDLLDARGAVVATLIKGERLAIGEYHRALDMTGIPSGTYLVSLRVNGVPSVLRLELTK